MAEEEGHHHHSLRKNEEDQKNNLLIYSTAESCSARPPAPLPPKEDYSGVPICGVPPPVPCSSPSPSFYDDVEPAEDYSGVPICGVPPPSCYFPSISGAPARSERPSITKLVVRPRAPQTNPNTNPNVELEGDEAIDEEAAICKRCFSIFSEANIVKIKCKCINALALAHEACVGDNCDVCSQEIQKTHVTLLRVTVSTAADREKKSKNCGRFPCFR